MNAGQLALMQNQSIIVGLTDRHKDYNQMSKLKVQVELVDILVSILQMQDQDKIIKNLSAIPNVKLPEWQKETFGGREIILKKCKKCNDDVRLVISDIEGGRIVIVAKEKSFIESKRMINWKFKKYILEFSNKLFKVHEKSEI